MLASFIDNKASKTLSVARPRIISIKINTFLWRNDLVGNIQLFAYVCT